MSGACPWCQQPLGIPEDEGTLGVCLLCGGPCRFKADPAPGAFVPLTTFDDLQADDVLKLKLLQALSPLYRQRFITRYH